ncbi:unnamed protein product [Mucor hiemalis]
MGQYKCCCCIPVRAGVLIIALLSAAVYIACTVGLFMAKANQESFYSYLSEHAPTLNNADSKKVTDGVLYTSIAVSILFSLTSLFGVLGSITQQRRMINIFKVSYWFVAVLSFLVSIAAIVALGVQRSQIVAACVAENADLTYDNCSTGYRNFMIVFSIVLMVVSFIQFYFATAISSYATRLRRSNMHEKLRNLEDFPEPPHKTEFF